MSKFISCQIRQPAAAAAATTTATAAERGAAAIQFPQQQRETASPVPLKQRQT